MSRKFAILSLIIAAIAIPATAANLTVPGSYPNIQAAINAAVDGDTIIVSNGTYTGVGNRDIDFNGKEITVRSEDNDPTQCIIDCQSADRGFYFHNSETSNSEILGFTIINGSADFGGAIECDGASPVINKCIIKNNVATSLGGAIDCYAGSPSIKNCIFENNTSPSDGGAIELIESSPVIFNCLFFNNNAGGNGNAIDCDTPSSPTITNCTIADNTSTNGNNGVYSIGVSPVIRNSILWNNGDDLNGASAQYSCIQDGDAGTGNITTNPAFRTGPLGNYYLTQIIAGQLTNSPCFNATVDSPTSLAGYSTATNNTADTGNADMGFHYDASGTVNQFTLTTVVDSGIGGTISPASGNSYDEFSEIALTATPDANYAVESWTGSDNDASTANNNVVTMTVAKTVTVKFMSTLAYTVTTMVSGSNGTIDSIPSPVLAGNAVTINAYPDSGYIVKSWFEGPTATFNIADSATYTTTTSTSSVYNTTVNSNTTIAVEFAAKYRLNCSVDPNTTTGLFNGTISPKRSDHAAGTVTTITAIPDFGFQVRKWTGTDNPTNTALTDTVTVISNNQAASVEFEPAPMHMLTINIVGSGSGTVTPLSGQFPEGSTVNMTATPATGSTVESWTDANPNANDLNSQPGYNQTTNFVVMNSPKTITVEFHIPTTIHVPGYSYPYLTIQDALNTSRNGDTIRIADGTYPGTGFVVNKGITIVGNPDDPNMVVIDCNNYVEPGFILLSNDPITLNGLTIANAEFQAPTPLLSDNDKWDPNNIRQSGGSGYSSFGAGIDIDGNHRIYNTIVRNCIARAARGRDGADGNLGDFTTEPKHIPLHCGGHGGNGGVAFGAGISIRSGSPDINNVLIEDCQTLGGRGANGGNGLDASTDDPFDSNFPGGPGGNGGNGGGAYGGGIACLSGTSPTFANCVIRNCVAISGGGGDGGMAGVGARSDQIAVDPCNPTTIVVVGYGQAGHGGCPGPAFGGGIFVDAGSTATFKNCNIINNDAQSSVGGNGGNSARTIYDDWPGGLGGLADMNTVSAYIDYVINDVNYASIDPNLSFGTGLSLDPNFIVMPKQTNFFVGLPLNQVTANSLEDYTAKGGGVFIEHQTNATFENCIIKGNSTKGATSGIGGYHGGNLIWAGWPYLGASNNSKFAYPSRHYRVPSFGNGVYLGDNTSTQFKGCDIQENYYTSEDTNDVWLMAHDQFIDLTQNPPVIPGHPGTETTTTFDPPYTYPYMYLDMYGDEYLSYGGGFCFDSAIGSGTQTTIDDCNISDNNSPIGGGIYAQDMIRLDVNDCNISGNLAILGGGLFSIGNTSKITKTTFEKNIANAAELTGDLTKNFGDGGAVYNFASDTQFIDCVFNENIAGSAGGGLLFEEQAFGLANPLITNCLITSNKAKTFGGGVFLDIEAATTISQSTIAHNAVTGADGFGGGFAADYGSSATITNSIVWANRATTGAQISILDSASGAQVPASLQINNSDIDLRNGLALEFVEDSSGTGTSSTTKVVDSQTINNAISANGTANVIVTLNEDSVTQGTNWNSPASVNILRSEIAILQSSVMGTLDASEFTMSHQMDNVAILSGQTNQAGLDKLINNSSVKTIEPVRTLYPAMAQAVSLANASDIRLSYNGGGVSVAIVDTGIDYTHPMLGGGGFPNGKVIGGYDTGDNDNDPMPVEGYVYPDGYGIGAHGTNCAGNAAGSLGEVGDYVGGIAYNAKLYALKASQNDDIYQTFNNDAIIAAWDWCLTHKNDDPANPILVVSNSLGTPYLHYNNADQADSENPAYVVAVNRLIQAGITLVAASGNEGQTDGISVPAAISGIISVGALYDTTGEVTNYSNTADILDIFAPADPVYTTDLVGNLGYDGDYYPYFNGTSSACPIAAGCVAAIQSAAIQIRGSALTPAEIRELLVTSGSPVTDSKVAITKPMVDLGNAIAMLTDTSPIYAAVVGNLSGVEPNSAPGADPNSDWVIEAGFNNMSEDPNFSFAYYLSHTATGQDYNSPCFDAGSGLASILGYSTYTTRTDGFLDVNIVDLGYHHLTSYPTYNLHLDVNLPDPVNDANYHGYIVFDWNSAQTTDSNFSIYKDTLVKFEAIPDANYRVAKWFIEFDDPNENAIPPYETTNRYFSRVIDQNMHISVEFEYYIPSNIFVPGQYTDIQEAIEAASDGDIILLDPRGADNPYYITDVNGLNFMGKAITLTQADPLDPNEVAKTVIDCNNNGRALLFDSAEDANTIISGITFRNCSMAGAFGLDGGMGAVYDPCDSNTFYDAGDATGDGYGGAVYCGIDTSPVISNCVFINCEVTGGRGGDGIKGPFVLDDADRANRGGHGGNGFGDGFGGAFYCGRNSRPTITNCRFEDIRANGGIGGDGGDGGDGGYTTDNAKIAGDGGDGGDGYGIGHGAIVYADVNAVPVFTDCNMINNIATMGQGGKGGTEGVGKLATSDEIPAYNGSDGSNNGSGYGGIAYYAEESAVDFNNCNITDNTADIDGGAFYIEPNCVSVSLVKCNINGNTATIGNGGAIMALVWNDITMDNCQLGGNSAGAEGGALYVGSLGDANLCTINLNRCIFTDNTAAEFGGAIIARNFTADMNNCFINRNTGSYGGGMYLVGEESSIKYIGGAIMGNSASDEFSEGGGIYVAGLPITIINAQISENLSAYAGGGMVIKGIESMGSEIYNCLFVGNTAGARGGALLTTINTSPVIKGCTFSKNRTEIGGMGGAILAIYGSSPEIKYNIFDKNYRVAVYEGSADSSVNMSWCMFTENYNGDYYRYNDPCSPYTTYYPQDSTQAQGNIVLAAMNLVTDGNNVLGFHNDPNSGDANVDKNFDTGPLGSYYLAQATTVTPGPNCPAVNAGDIDANTLSIPLVSKTFNDYTTRIDSVNNTIDTNDVGKLDFGYHYRDVNDATQFSLTVSVLGSNGTVEILDPNGSGNVYDVNGPFYEGMTYELLATPTAGWRVAQWSGSDNDNSYNTINRITMTSSRTVYVSFEQPRLLYVPGEYTAIQYAINDAKDSDTIIVGRGTYGQQDTNFDTHITINGKNITITSTAPDDPCVVAETVFIASRWNISDVDRSMVIDGITIKNAHWGGGDCACPPTCAAGPTGDGHNGGSILGGAMRLFNASPTIRNCRFEDCTAWGGDAAPACAEWGDGGWGGYARGGAIGIGIGSSPYIKNTSFIDCRVTGGNGGDAQSNKGHGGSWGDPNDDVWHTWDWAPVGGYEDYWYYSGYGGAIYISGGTEPIIENCLFEDNFSTGGKCGNSWVEIASWPQQNYEIDSFGGAVYIEAGGKPTFIGCTFQNNEADARGQIPSGVPGDANEVLSDAAISYGGAIAMEDAVSPKFEACDFNDNIACVGGTMYIENTDALIELCEFKYGKSMMGGGICLFDSNSIIYDSKFISNYAIDPIGEGGAIYNGSSSAQFIDCQITNNSASISGGGLYFTGEREPNMFNCLVNNNIANRDGGGVSANWYTMLNIDNCTIADNLVTGNGFTESYGGGISCAYNGYVQILNGIIWQNSAQFGSSISIGSNFDSADKPMAEVFVEFSDIHGGQANVFVDTDHNCVLDWDISNFDGTSNDNPLFVQSYYFPGDYYLSQILASDVNDPVGHEQTVDSICVDAGSGTARENDLYRHTTRTDHILDIPDSNADMGYHYVLYADLTGDFDFDVDVDNDDLLSLLAYWLYEDCQFPDFCHGRDINEDGEVNFDDFALFAKNFNTSETNPPSPSTMLWETPPEPNGSAEITMTAVKAVDNSGKTVYYYFECITDSGFDSGWTTDRTYFTTGFATNTSYAFRVRATDGYTNIWDPDDSTGNKTKWSIVAYTTLADDTTAPTPETMAWATVPTAVSANSVTMTAVTATDTTAPVEYMFVETSGNPGATSSGWQTSTTYEDAGLDPNTEYGYYVIARDGNYNTNNASPIEYVITSVIIDPNDSNDIDPPVPTSDWWASAPEALQDGSFYRHYMTAGAFTDATGPVEYLFAESDGTVVRTWSEDASYVSGYLFQTDNKCYKFKVRDKAVPPNETGWSNTLCTY